MNKRNVYGLKDSGKTFLWALLLPQILAVVVVMFFSRFYETAEQMQGSLAYTFVAMLISQLAFVIVYFWHNKKNNINFVRASKINFRLSLKNVLLCILISVVAVVGFMYFVSLFANFFAKVGFSASDASLPNNTFAWFLLNVVLSAILPAVMEELIFRGIIFNGLSKRGFWFASIVSSVMFMIVHLSIYSFVYPLVMGIVFCLVLQKTGSIVYTMIIHFCNNFIVKLIDYYNNVTNSSIGALGATTWWQKALIVLGAIVAFGIIWFIVKKCLSGKNENDENQIPQFNISADEKKQENISVFGSLAVGVVIWIVIVISSIL